MDGWGRADPAGVWLEAAGSGNRGSVAVGGSLGRPIGLATSSSPPPPRGVGGWIRLEGGARRPALATQAAGFGGVGRRRRR
jgi:hypothetical protein